MTQVQTVKTYAARRRLRVGTEYRDGPRRTVDPVTVEHLLPEGHLWPKVSSLVHTGMVREVEVPIEDLFAAFELRQISSADALAILERLGLKDGVTTHGPHGSPRATGTRGAPRVTRTATAELSPAPNPGPGQYRNRRKPVKAAVAPVKKAAAKKAPREKARTKRTTTSKKGAGTAVLIPMREVQE